MADAACRYRSGLRHWHPLLPSRRLGRRPRRQLLCGQALVLFRTASGQAAALAEVCPHRRMSLAAGTVRGEQLLCAYHGWRFAADGSISCPLMPAVALQQQAFQVREADGLIWVRRPGKSEQPHEAPPLPSWPRGDLLPAGLTLHTVAAPLEVTLDNFTETEHTTTIHQVFGFRDPAAVTLRLELEPASHQGVEQRPPESLPPAVRCLHRHPPPRSLRQRLDHPL
ncbi:Rieske 2Fe-2S domain-containing protein [Vulcanococcus limneticus Candia 3F8]|uniref:Rieske 2Fe-2S domain-containing protein n=1 Tax=Vulcanococcus limneticus TaxID=2170428 RepID=UPI000B9816F2|nr:Rieske 2Fe-2S domain-containing protein [Vulcanococcus limneticus]MCP9793024.1 Rieske 2Fe-2S domain-containing protein [Vulcanococcus limneticus MW73D5]MCP9895019.1 Rieske 2Fe-2S domain-containing protein [Vulcanococcus limneticus Candia 3F8]MCP9898422.1 Rieske 2Fe-2S domain-containing protein [Vulcanococcus limneticus Candia 3B3]